jgi:pre-mRNA 3'-end-processing factor FIP1
MTTEYTPQRRQSLPAQSTDPPAPVQPTIQPATQPSRQSSSIPQPEPPITENAQPKIDTSGLPPVTAPSTHPSIDPSVPGVHDGRPIFEHDMDSFAEKPWRRPGSNLSDWFNYGFDEISWEAYCYRRRQLGEDADVLRANVIVCRISFHK